ncbi:hypothetical protein BASA62_007420 [Batrachochytrium salamandrivorans]|nr:hypothetical protein BASA62_007420 [Batrachochytrium salamandrivorans]
MDSDDEGPKSLQIVPQPRKRNNKKIKLPKVEFDPDLSGPPGLDISISTGSHQTSESKGSTHGQTKRAAPKGSSLKPIESAPDPYKSFKFYDERWTGTTTRLSTQ